MGELISIDALLRKVLLQRELRTPGSERVDHYSCAGKQFVRRYSELAGSSAYSKDRLDATIDDFCRAKDAGWISEDRFREARRLAADIEDVADYGAVGDDRLPAWGKRRNPLSRPVSPDVKNDMEDVMGLSFAVVKAMEESGYSQRTVDVYRKFALPRVIWHFIDGGSTSYSEEALESFADEAERKYRDKIERSRYSYLESALKHVKSMHDERRLYFRRFDGARTRAVSGPDAAMVIEFEEWCRSVRRLKDSSITHNRFYVGTFLEKLGELGCNDLAHLERGHVRKARSAMSEGQSAHYVSKMLTSIRCFADFVEAEHTEIPAFRNWIGPGPKIRRKKPIIGYSVEQAEAIVASVDVSRPTGLRDRAMLMLAKNTGIRAVDIVNLRIPDIKWREGTVSIVQQKNGRPLLLPLDTETGEALAEYILHGRRKGSGLDFVFLTALGQIGPLSTSTLHSIVKKHAKPITGPAFEGLHGVHAFRRGLGGSLVEAEVPPPEISVILGHSEVASTAPYMAVAVERLRICATGLADVPLEGRGPM